MDKEAQAYIGFGIMILLIALGVGGCGLLISVAKSW